MFWTVTTAIILLLLAYQWIVLVALPGKIAATGLRGDHDAAIARLETLLKLPTFMGDTGRMFVLFHLADRCVIAKRYADAMPYFQRLFALPQLPPELSPMIHQRYGDCCEALGRPQEAVEHRHFAVNTAQPSTYQEAVARGSHLDRENQVEEAYEVYAHAVATVKCDPRQKAVLNARLATAAMRAGRPDATVAAAEAAIALPAAPAITGAMHRIAGVAYTNLGDLDRANDHLQIALKMAEGAGERAHQAETLASLSAISRNRGKLAEGLAVARRAVSLVTPPPRVANIYLYEALMALGLYQEAWQVVTGVAEDVAFMPHHQRTYAAIDNLLLCRICLDFGRAEDAMSYWQHGMKGFQNDTKMAPYLRAMGAVILAQLGRTDEARAEAQWVERTLQTAPLGRGNKIDCYFYRIWSTSLTGDHADCLANLARLRALEPFPYTLAKPLTFAAESCLSAGDRDTARALLAEATEACLESPWAQKAKERLLQI